MVLYLAVVVDVRLHALCASDPPYYTPLMPAVLLATKVIMRLSLERDGGTKLVFPDVADATILSSPHAHARLVLQKESP